jgi:2-(1,2-epoxy-1,2-dihydrophenyl)acetyl-CoA isomerase
MDYQAITVEIADGIGVITLNRPDVMNALNAQLRAELRHALPETARTARVIVLTGAGRAFCSGQDLGDARGAADLNLEQLLRDDYEPMLAQITDCAVPVIAAVNGIAAGAGANLALMCDVVIAAESAAFMQAFSKIGLMPDAGGTWALPRQIGLARAMGAALFAEKIEARRAADWGMIWEAVPDDLFAAHWQERARQVAKGPTLAFRNIRRAMQASHSSTLADQLALEATLQGECGRSRDFNEGVLAFLDKRKAEFEGR